VATPDREAIPALLSLPQYVDLCMPRGGEGLIRAVAECSKVPVIKHYKGVCHVFVEAEADLAMAEAIVVNAKCQRPAGLQRHGDIAGGPPDRCLVHPTGRRAAGREAVELHVDAETEAVLNSQIRNPKSKNPTRH